MRETIRELGRLPSRRWPQLELGAGLLGEVALKRLRIWAPVDGRGLGAITGISLPIF